MAATSLTGWVARHTVQAQRVERERMRFSVILVPDETGRISVSVPALPGCVCVGRSREEALTRVRDAIAGWLEVEAATGHQPIVEMPGLIGQGAAQALEIIDKMRAAGELPSHDEYELDVVCVEVQPPVVA